MKKYKILIVLSLLAAPVLVGAQQKNANISFNNLIHDFGEIQESEGSVSHNFEFTNTGNEPLIIQRVTASCGCTTPSWTKEPVMPGEKGFVKAAFNPANRPGKFSKTVTVQTNASTPSIRLTIMGNVIPKPLSLEDQYRYSMGPLRFETNHVSFGTVYKGNPVQKKLEFINNSEAPVSIEIRDVPAHIGVSIPKKKVNPGETGTIEVKYLSENKNDWDFVIDRLPVYMNGTSDRNYRLIVSANIQEDFSSMSPSERENSATIDFNDKNFDFGKLTQGETISHEYTFTNTGKSDLLIRKVRASCGCTAILTDKKVIAPGEEGSIKVTFNSQGKMGNQNKTVTVITNDPAHPREVLWVRGEVVE